jgi:hypothetical protein
MRQLNVEYPDGQEVRLGDTVELWSGNTGRVVCSIDTGEYSDDYRKDHWASLGSGVLVLSEKAGLIHYIEPEKTMRLLGRQRSKGGI